MEQDFLVVSFYTAGTGYEKQADRLMGSLRNLNIAHDVRAVESTGSWVKNCAMKPAFIEGMLDQYERPIVWLDADAEVLRPLPVFQNADFEFAVNRRHRRDLDKRWGPWNSGTLYFDAGPRARRLLFDWVDLGQQEPKAIDQVTLYKAFRGMHRPPELWLLPWSYTTVFDERGRPSEPHIIHHQASRQLKHHV